MTVALTRALLLEGRVSARDGAGGIYERWETLGTLWADMRPRTGGAASGQEAALSRSLWKITVRPAPVGAPSRPVPGQRLREGDRIFSILSVNEEGPAMRWLVLQAEEELVR